MKTLLKHCRVVNVFTAQIDACDVLLSDEKIIGVDQYEPADADVTYDLEGKYVCPGFIDGHIHIESTTLTPAEFARATVPHGTTSIIADPHEIANVCGINGIEYMLAASEGIPLTVYLALPSCVPSTPFCESGAALPAAALKPLYAHPRVVGLGEVMNYVGVIHQDPDLLQKIEDARAAQKTVNGHAPLLSGQALDAYIANGIRDDHECTSAKEAMERIRKGQRVMIRQGPNSQNLRSLLPLFEQPWASRCLLVTDDKHPADLLTNGHIDDMIRTAVREGKDPVTAICMATLWAAQAFDLREVGAVAPGYVADLLVLDDLQSLLVRQVFRRGRVVAKDGQVLPFADPVVPAQLMQTVRDSFCLGALRAEDLILSDGNIYKGKKACRVISVIKGELLTDQAIETLDFDQNDGIDPARDILKLAVIERHGKTGNRGIGYIRGMGLKKGAMAASVSHDSHNLILIGTNEADMAVAGNRIRSLGGGFVVVADGKVIGEMPLPIAGLMSDAPAAQVARQNEQVRRAVYQLGVPLDCKPFLTMAFVSLPVIPHLKLTTHGYVHVDRQCLVPLVVDSPTTEG